MDGDSLSEASTPDAARAENDTDAAGATMAANRWTMATRDVLDVLRRRHTATKGVSDGSLAALQQAFALAAHLLAVVLASKTDDNAIYVAGKATREIHQGARGSNGSGCAELRANSSSPGQQWVRENHVALPLSSARFQRDLKTAQEHCSKHDANWTWIASWRLPSLYGGCCYLLGSCSAIGRVTTFAGSDRRGRVWL